MSFRKSNRLESLDQLQGRRRFSAGKESSSWRLSLHTIFVSNLDRLVTARDLWRLFNVYGVVVDVFLPNDNGLRRTRFAFVRYRYPEEHRRAVLEGNELRVAGRKILVRKATVRRLDRRQQRRQFTRHDRSLQDGGKGNAPRTVDGSGIQGCSNTKNLKRREVECVRGNERGEVRKVSGRHNTDQVVERHALAELDQEQLHKEKIFLGQYSQVWRQQRGKITWNNRSTTVGRKGEATRRENDSGIQGILQTKIQQGQDVESRPANKGRQECHRLSMGRKVEKRYKLDYAKRRQELAEKEQEKECSEPIFSMQQTPDSRNKSSKSTAGLSPPGEAKLDLHIPEVELEWLFRSAVGYLHQRTDIMFIRQKLWEGGLDAQARKITDVRILVTFSTEEEMKKVVKHPPKVLQDEFLRIIPWVMVDEETPASLWIKMEQVPLELWHMNFFRALGNNWGEFLELDENTAMRKSFDFARMKLLVKDRDNVPDQVTGKAMGVHFNLSITVEEFIYFSQEPNLQMQTPCVTVDDGRGSALSAGQDGSGKDNCLDAPSDTE